MKKMITTLGLLAVCSVTTIGCAGKQKVDNSALEACQASEAQARADLEAAQARLAKLESEGAELRALLDERAKLEAELRKVLAEMIEAGELTITSRRGLLVIQLPNQILFESGSAKLSPQGVKVLTQVGTALSNLEAQRRILLAGHTDNVPIAAKAKEFDSNWALSAKRARAALDVMIKAGVPTDVLGMAGFGEFDPIADNSSDDGKAQNRRTEIVLIPDLEKILETSAKKSAENVTMR
jgi:chemotaxis protein MotB